ncbi:MAG TPA: matrixin family metalloprotease [Polyangia bacterium]|nr:matrixin family metalloprotease [Polyangia bacterium]
MRAALAALLTVLLPSAARAYVRTTTAGYGCTGVARPLFWRATTVPYVIDAAGSDDIMDSSAFDAVQASFQTWQVSCSYLGFRFDGKLPDAPIGYVPGGSNVNAVKWIETGWTSSSRAVAITLLTFQCTSGEIFDGDITLNGTFFHFTTSGAQGAQDVQNTVTHEVGHLIGFDHSPDPESTMYADAPAGETKKRDLTADDIQGVCDVYPNGQPPPPAPPSHHDDNFFGCAAFAGAPPLCGLVLAAALLLALAYRRWR